MLAQPDRTSTLDRLALTRVIAVATGKGGSGKTSITSNVGGLLAAAGYRVLLVDLDSQANLCEDLGVLETDDGQSTFNAVIGGAALTPITVRTNLDLVTAGDFTEDLAIMLDGRRSRVGEQATLESLAKALAPIAGDYDFILLDCPPKGRVIQEIALGAARWLLIPSKTDSSSRKAIKQIGKRFVVARETNPVLDLLGVVIFGSGTSSTRRRGKAMAEINADLGTENLMFDAYIRHVEATSALARETGRLVHELEDAKEAQEPFYRRLQAAAAGTPGTADEPIADSVAGLASDYQQLTTQIVARISSAEAGEQ